MQNSIALKRLVTNLNARHFRLRTHEKREVRSSNNSLLQRCRFDCEESHVQKCCGVHFNISQFNLGFESLVLDRSYHRHRHRVEAKGSACGCWIGFCLTGASTLERYIVYFKLLRSCHAVKTKIWLSLNDIFTGLLSNHHLPTQH